MRENRSGQGRLRQQMLVVRSLECSKFALDEGEGTMFHLLAVMAAGSWMNVVGVGSEFVPAPVPHQMEKPSVLSAE